MRKLLVIFCVFIFTISLIAIDVFGNQSGIWSPENNPYNIVGDITVPFGETLEIEAGVEVIAVGNYKITAMGNIIAQGTYNDSIRFHFDNGLSWGGIRLENETVQSTFDYCRISNTDDINNYPIQSINSPVLINHSYLDDHQSGVSFFALSSDDPSYMEIKNSKIAYVQKSGITITDNSNALIDSCEVTQCGLGTQFYGAIRLLLMDNSHSCSPTITNNYIHHNGKQGITMANIYNYYEMAPTVEYNEVSYNYTGIYLYFGKGTYKWNHIHHNFVENNPDSGAGVMLYGSGADAVFTFNEINNNYTGFYLTDGATANLGDLENASTDDDGYNCIYDNIFYTGEEFTVYNASALDMKAENTVWDDDPPIDVTIIDGNDNPAYGIVDYEPTLTPYAPPAGLGLSVYGQNVFIYGTYGVKYPTYLYPDECNLYLNGSFLGTITSPFFLIPGLPYGTHTFGATYVYEGYHESTITDTTIYIPSNLCPPTNVVLNPFLGIIFWEPPENSNATLIGYNIYLDDMSCPVSTVGVDIFEYQYTGLIPGQQYTAGVSAVYEGLGESFIVMDFGLGPYICNPPTNASYEIIDDHIHLTWQEPEPGSTYPFLNYRIYLDGELFETTELYYDIYDLVSGQTYLVGLTAFYEYLFESDPIEFEIMFVGADDVLTLETKLLGNYPNPFNPETTISFNISRKDAKNAKIEIYNLKGQKIKTFPIDQLTNQPVNQIIWDGTDENGKEVSSGIYLYKLQTNHKTFTRKMLLIK